MSLVEVLLKRLRYLFMSLLRIMEFQINPFDELESNFIAEILSYSIALESFTYIYS